MLPHSSLFSSGAGPLMAREYGPTKGVLDSVSGDIRTRSWEVSSLIVDFII